MSPARAARCASIMLVAGLIGLSGSFAQDAPPTKIVVGFAAGGIADVLARVYADEFKTRLKRTTIVENRPGGSGMIAAASVSRAAPDGTTLIMLSGTYTIVPAMQKLTFDPKTALTPISLIATSPNLLVVRKDAPYADVRALIAAAKADPTLLSYASSGNGTTVHFMSLLLQKEAGITLNHIPYKSSGESLQAVLGGHVPMAFSAVNSAISVIQSGELRALAVAGRTRSSFLPEVPTFAELGYPQVLSDTWLGLAAPVNMPATTVTHLARTVEDSLQRPDIRKKIADLGAEPVGLDPATFGEMITSEIDRFEQLARTANIEKN